MNSQARARIPFSLDLSHGGPQQTLSSSTLLLFVVLGVGWRSHVLSWCDYTRITLSLHGIKLPSAHVAPGIKLSASYLRAATYHNILEGASEEHSRTNWLQVVEGLVVRTRLQLMSIPTSVTLRSLLQPSPSGCRAFVVIILPSSCTNLSVPFLCPLW